jgi:S-DNA-T family DNA segregation ATPase FtsK/SpoIIIE
LKIGRYFSWYYSPVGKRTKKSRAKEDESEFGSVMQSETVRGVFGIFLLAISAFLGLAAFGVAGFLGERVYGVLSALLGVGYALLPLSVIMIAFVLFRSFKERVSILRTASGAVFFLAALGLVNVILPGRAGIIGETITSPLIAAVDTAATIIFLLAFIVAAIFVAFDAHPGRLMQTISGTFLRIRERDDVAAVEDDPDVIMPEGVGSEEEDGHEDDEGEPEEEEEKPTRKFWEISTSENTHEKDSIPTITAIGGTYTPPPVSLLGKNRGRPGVGDVKANANIIKRTLQNFGIQVEMDEVSIGPTVTRYAMKPAEGVRLTKILTLQSNLELALAASPVRIEAPIPGQSLVGIEVPNTSRTTLGLAPLLSHDTFTQSEKPLLLVLGRTISGNPEYADLARMPHLLIAGSTGTGKSVTIHDLVVSLLYRRGPDQLRLMMVDPKRVELTLYNSIPHLLTPVITDAKKAILGLKWLAKEMDRRYDVLEAEGVRDIASYHANVLEPALRKDPTAEDLPEPMPYIVVIIDELADIMSAYPRELEAAIVRLAQMSRAVGIHLVLSTQRPSVKVITGLIKANMPARVALQVSSQIDSRTILDMGGAEKLLGAGDLLFLSGEMSKPKRIQAPFISENEVKAVVKHIARSYEDMLPDEIDFSTAAQSNGVDPIFSATIDDGDEDDLYPEAKQAVLEAGKASTSYLQRKLRIGYARAARLMDMLEEHGVIGPGDGAKPREVYREGEAGTVDEEEEEVYEEREQV